MLAIGDAVQFVRPVEGTQSTWNTGNPRVYHVTSVHDGGLTVSLEGVAGLFLASSLAPVQTGA